jgi:hypothetical protein
MISPAVQGAAWGMDEGNGLCPGEQCAGMACGRQNLVFGYTFL